MGGGETPQEPQMGRPPLMMAGGGGAAAVAAAAAGGSVVVVVRVLLVGGPPGMSMHGALGKAGGGCQAITTKSGRQHGTFESQNAPHLSESSNHNQKWTTARHF